MNKTQMRYLIITLGILAIGGAYLAGMASVVPQVIYRDVPVYATENLTEYQIVYVDKPYPVEIIREVPVIQTVNVTVEKEVEVVKVVEKTVFTDVRKQFKSVREIREWVRGLPLDYGQMVDRGWACRHIAHYRWLQAMEQGYLVGITWQTGTINHMENFTVLEDGSFYQIDVAGNVNPMLGWENYKFDW